MYSRFSEDAAASANHYPTDNVKHARFNNNTSISPNARPYQPSVTQSTPKPDRAINKPFSYPGIDYQKQTQTQQTQNQFTSEKKFSISPRLQSTTAEKTSLSSIQDRIIATYRKEILKSQQLEVDYSELQSRVEQLRRAKQELEDSIRIQRNQNEENLHEENCRIDLLRNDLDRMKAQNFQEAEHTAQLQGQLTQARGDIHSLNGAI